MNSLIFSRKIFVTSVFCGPVNNITIIGSGLMGSGIAQVSANSGLNVVLVDKSNEILAKAVNGIKKSVSRIAKKEYENDEMKQKNLINNVLSNISTSTNISKSVLKSDLIIEAILENVEIKQKLFQQIENSASENVIIASNTSSLKLSDIGKNLKKKTNFGGLHFFNPVPVMKLLEVVRHDETSDETFNTLFEYGKKVGKVPVACKDTPGFIVNRLLVPYLLEALRLFERGDASKEDIDIAMKLGAGYPMGPFELCDYVGLDTTQFIQDGWQKKYPNEPLFRSSKILSKLVSEGKFGRKTGEGFYKYD